MFIKFLISNNLLVPQVLKSGELVISSLRWTDMGEFSCEATNIFGSQMAKTFVYPAKVSFYYVLSILKVFRTQAYVQSWP